MHSLETYLHTLYSVEYLPQKKINEHECFRLLWIKVILRAAYDWVLYRNSKSHIYKNIAEDAYRWIFDPPKERKKIVVGKTEVIVHTQEFNSLENICDAINLDVDSVRRFSKRLTRDMVKKLEFLERSTKPKGKKKGEEADLEEEED